MCDCTLKIEGEFFEVIEITEFNLRQLVSCQLSCLRLSYVQVAGNLLIRGLLEVVVDWVLLV